MAPWSCEVRCWYCLSQMSLSLLSAWKYWGFKANITLLQTQQLLHEVVLQQEKKVSGCERRYWWEAYCILMLKDYDFSFSFFFMHIWGPSVTPVNFLSFSYLFSCFYMCRFTGSWTLTECGISVCICVHVCVCVCPCVPPAFVFLSQFYIPALRGECFLWVPLLFFNIYLTFCLSSDYWNDCKLVWNNRLLQSFVSGKKYDDD